MSEVLRSGSRYFLRISNCLITRSPYVIFVRGRHRNKVENLVAAPDDFMRVAGDFLKSAEQWGGDALAIYLITEAMMAKKVFLVINVEGAAVLSKNLFEADAQKVMQANPGTLMFSDQAEFDKLTEAQRCAIARPYLNDKEKDSTPDGPGFAAQAWKIACRFVNPKPAKDEKTGGASAPKEPAAPRPPGVKVKIADLFKDGTKHLSTEEIMVAVSGTKPSVVTAISDLRSAKYCGSSGIVNLVLLAGKYALSGGSAAVNAQAEHDRLEKEAVDKKAADAKAKADKKAADAVAAKAKADEKAAAAKTPAAGATATA